QMSQARLGSRRRVGVNDALHAGPVELLGCQPQLRLGRGQIAGGDRLAHLADLRLYGRFRGPVLGPFFEALPEPLFRTLGSWHSLLVHSCRPIWQSRIVSIDSELVQPVLPTFT